MGNNQTDGVQRVGVSLYPTDKEIVQRKADQMGVNFSLALRLIIREWDDTRIVMKPPETAVVEFQR